MTFAPDGVISDDDPADIAEEVLWEGEPKVFLDALIESGFADRCDDCIRIHDWDEYTGKLLDKRAKDRERKRNYKTANSQDDISCEEDRRIGDGDSTEVPRKYDGTSAERRGNSVATQHNTTQPDTTQHDLTLHNTTEPSACADANGGAEPKPPKRKKTDEKKTEPPKTQYAEFVSMTNDEYQSLVTKLGEQGAARCVELLDNYKGANGKTYASDYRAILNWVIKRYEEERAKYPPPNAGNKPRQSNNPFINAVIGDGEG